MFAQSKLTNLRNKYKNHAVIKPLINYCDCHDISFEFMKEKRIISRNLKSFKFVNTYYMKIGDKLIDSTSLKLNDLFALIVEAYRYLGMEYHDNIVKTAKLFNKKL